MTQAAGDLNLIRAFVAVAEAGSFTVAAERLRVTRPQVSQQIRKLEDALGSQLLRRTTRQVVMTDEGRILFERCAPLIQGIEESLETVGGLQPKLSGRLRISAPVDQAARVLAPVVTEFARLHPQLHIDVQATDRIEDLIAEGIDVSIRVGWLKDSSLRVAKLGEFHQAVLASPRYLARRGSVRTPDELATHDWVALSLLRAPLTWTFEKGQETVRVRMTSQIKTDSPTVLRALLIEGAGISIGSTRDFAQEIQSGHLIQLLPEWSLPSGGIFAMFPPGAHISGASRAFVELLRSRMNCG